MEKKIVAESPQQLPIAAKELLNYCSNQKIFAIYGEMGVGKTTFVKAICKELGSADNFSSPTFSIVNEYKAEKPIYHIDLYRLKSKAEAEDIGIEEYLYSGNYCFIEWPELIKDMLPMDAAILKMVIDESGNRIITIKK